MRENRLSGSMRGGARRSLAFGHSIRRLRLFYTCGKWQTRWLLDAPTFCMVDARSILYAVD